jgi:hypothetical protein
MTAEILFSLQRSSIHCWMSKIGISRTLAVLFEHWKCPNHPIVFHKAFTNNLLKHSLDTVLEDYPQYSTINYEKTNLMLDNQDVHARPHEIEEGPKFKVIQQFVDFRDVLLQTKLFIDINKPGLYEKDIAILMY